MNRTILALCVGALGAASAAGAAPTVVLPVVVSEAAARRTLDLTVYNRDLALVREARELDLPGGPVRIEFRDVPARIDPTSLRVEGGAGFSLQEQNYEFDLLSRDRVLQKYVGREVTWLQEDGSAVTGTLLGMNDGPVYRVDGRIVFEVPGRIALPDLPADLRERPTLVWLVQTDKARRPRVEASYLTGGISWKTDYVLDLDDAGRKAALQAWVTLDNQSGGGYEGATLRLVAGDVNRVSAPRPRVMYDSLAMSAAPEGKGFSESALYDYHLYTLDRPVDLKDRQIKQINLFEHDGVPVERLYRLRADVAVARAGDGLLPVEVAYRFRNDKAAGLDLPLPAGVFRVYGDSDGGRQLLGEDSIEHTPKGEAVRLTVGRAFDVVGERVVVRTERLGDRGQRLTVKVTLRNHKTEKVTVEVAERAWGEWNITASTLPVRRISATEFAFDVPVAADGETVLDYTLEMDR